MTQRILETRIEIDASPHRVWSVFTNPEITRQMGGEYVTDWQKGSAFYWKGLDGKTYTNGSVIEVLPEKLIRHNLFNSPKEKTEISVITYEFREHAGKTTLSAREEIKYSMTDKQYRDALEGWKMALSTVKKISESLSRI